MPEPPAPPDAPQQWGDYRVGDILAEGVRTRTYRAEQISVRREVILEQLKPEAVSDPPVVEAFFDDVRAKAAVHHPCIGSVYEAFQADNGTIFYTRELLPGATLEDLHESGTRLAPPVVLKILQRVAEALGHLEERGAATLPVEPRHLVLGNHGALRLVNLAVAGNPDPRVAAQDRQLLAELLLDLLEEGRPGATRTTSLLHQLGSDRPDAPAWGEVAPAATKLIRMLEHGRHAASQRIGVPGATKRGPGALLVAAGVLLGALGVVGGGLFLVMRDQPPPARVLDGMIAIPGDPGESMAPFWIDAEEVTIAEYSEFLAALAILDPADRGAYDHPDQPPSKGGHLPDDWEALHGAAEAGRMWNGLPMDLNCPIINIDWWDAAAYADWRDGRLPTEREWIAAAQGATPASSAWGVVDAAPGDRTPAGVQGLAGNVAEWTREVSRNPAFPMNPRKPLACGGSYRDPHNGLRARLWLPSREARRPDLGFRVVRERPPD